MMRGGGPLSLKARLLRLLPRAGDGAKRGVALYSRNRTLANVLAGITAGDCFSGESTMYVL